MSVYIGPAPEFGNLQKQVAVPDSIKTSWALDYTIPDVQSVMVIYGGVPQEPGIAYTTDTTNLTFTFTPQTGKLLYWVFLGRILEVPVPGDNSVTAAKMAPNASPVLLTEQATTSGTEVDFSIPAGVRRIDIMFNGVSLSGAEHFLIQLGTSGGFEITGYTSHTSVASTQTTRSTGFVIFSASSGNLAHGLITLSRFNDSHTWVSSHVLGRGGASVSVIGGGVKTLSAELTQVRITNTNTGVNSFDAGAINIMYEGK